MMPTTMIDTLSSHLTQLQTRVEKKLQAVLPISESTLHQAMVYSVLNGGKRFRPALIYLTAETLNLALEAVDDIACAVELIHCYSLIHDDLPDMDNDDFRRGKPTCHKMFGTAVAILAGDALQTLAFELLSRPNPYLNAEQQLHIISLLTGACGAKGMAYGQTLDIENNTNIKETTLKTIHENKTGKLIKACIEAIVIAAQCEDDKTIQHLSVYGEHLGLAFQIKDDLLDVEGTIDDLGKLPGMDNALNKATYPSILGIDVAKKRLACLTQAMLALLDEIRLTDSRLAELTHFVTYRKN